MRRRIERHEEAIVTLEAKTKKTSKALASASTDGDASAITRLSKELHGFQSQIDHHFERLEELTIEHDWRAVEFDRDLGDEET